MKKPDKFPFASAGAPYIFGFFLLTAVSMALDAWWLAVPLALLFIQMVIFFRDPPRRPQAGPFQAVSPADGTVVGISRVSQADMPEGEAVLVSIFMNIFNVHVNRIPATGTVEKVTYQQGSFHAADDSRATGTNEQVKTLIRLDNGKRMISSQVAGLIARRIECRVLPGDSVQCGERYGMIRFGSRLDVYFPTDARIMVEPGQKVKAGTTVLGDLT